MILTQQFGFAFAKAHRAATTTAAALHLAHEKHKHSDNDEYGEAGYQQLGPDALLLGFPALHLNIVAEQIIHQLRILDHGSDGLEVGPVVPLRRYGETVDDHLAYAIVVNLFDKVGIPHLLGSALHAEIVEDGQQDGCNHQPQQQILSHVVQICFLSLGVWGASTGMFQYNGSTWGRRE